MLTIDNINDFCSGIFSLSVSGDREAYRAQMKRLDAADRFLLDEYMYECLQKGVDGMRSPREFALDSDAGRQWAEWKATAAHSE